MVLVIGEVLFDVFPQYRRIGGAPFNFAYHLHHLGLPVRFVSRIGADAPGREVLAFFESRGLDAGDLQLDPTHATGQVQVSLDNDAVPTFDIRPNMAYDHIDVDRNLEKLLAAPPRLIYFGTLAQRSPQGFHTLQTLLNRRHPDTRTFCDINLRPACYNREVILASLRQADLLKLSAEELEVVRAIVAGPAGDRDLIDRLQRDFDIAVVVLTRGAAGSEWHAPDNSCRLAPPPLAAVADTVGAGDAHAAMTAVGYLRRWPPAKTLAAANRLAAAVCSIPGALPDTGNFYTEMHAIIDG
jgi:fructokinase